MREDRKPISDQRKVWRMTDDAPLGEVLTVGSSNAYPSAEEAPGGGSSGPAKTKSVRYWRASSHDLATGLDIKDFSDTVPTEFMD